MSQLRASAAARRALLAGSAAAAMVAVGVVAISAQAAAAGCRAGYTVGTQWSGGFTADVAVTNLGDRLNGWTLTWTYGAGQTVQQAWNAGVRQSGTQVTATNASWNADLGTNATVSFGFNGSFTGSNPAPTSFALNGVTCTGVAATTAPTTPGTTAPTTSPTTTPTTRPPTTAPTATPAATPTVPPASYPGPGPVSGATGTHDPTIVKTPGGTYIVAQTGDNIPLSTSTDRTAFRAAGTVFPTGAPWTTTYTEGARSLWAPHISFHNNQYYLYYSASSFGSNRSAIFLATSPTGATGTWVNQGLVIESSASDNFNAIDPDLIVDDSGRWWLNFGSFWSGIKQVAINPATGKRADTTIRGIAGRNGGAIEAPTMFKHGDYYYLWVSFDLCCKGAASTYRIMVGRSTSPNGPFVDRNGTAMTAGGGTQVLAGRGSIHGPGHQHVFADTDAEVLVYHYYTDSGASRLGLNLIGYDTAGWPFAY
jgi:arabinan endo-1,5-alpha-L-arabinosidase